MNVRKAAPYVLIAFLLIALTLILWMVFFRNRINTNINLSRSAVIKEMQSLQRIETASFTVEKIIDGGTSGNALKEFLFGDKILLIAHGQSIAGFDLSQISEKDIKIVKQSITLTLPKPQILVTTLDNTQTRVYDRTRGILNPGDVNLESTLREAAQKSIEDASCQGGILTQASDNARKQLTSLLSALGFIEISIQIPNATCVVNN
ncbi:MAG: DUF4230 domain-containing protein [Candidatus Roizmanbacteria bacterium]|nr:DUF4230 domain-containing protein [Candidatus Roizmanbacteria bacterium]